MRTYLIVRFTNGHLEESALRVPKFRLFNKTNDRTKKRRVVVRGSSSVLLGDRCYSYRDSRVVRDLSIFKLLHYSSGFVVS